MVLNWLLNLTTPYILMILKMNALPQLSRKEVIYGFAKLVQKHFITL